MKKRIITAALLCCAVLCGCSENTPTDSTVQTTAETTAQTQASSAETSAKTESSKPEADSSDEKTIVTDLSLLTDDADFIAEEEETEFIFIAHDIPGKQNVELVDADTDEVVGKLLDDADLEHSGDDIMGDARYSIRYNIKVEFTEPEYGEEKHFHYYARYTDGDTEHRSDILEITAYEPFSEEFAEKEQTVQKRITELKETDEFEDASIEDRAELITELLKECEADGLIDKGSIHEGIETITYTIEGAGNGVMVKPFDTRLN